MVKIGVVSDTHINSFEGLPEKLLRLFDGLDIILHAGDLVNLSVFEGLKKLSPKVYAVRGNMDPPDVKRALPEKTIIQVKQFRIGLTHGRGAPPDLLPTVKKIFKGEALHCIIYGHSHVARNEFIEDILYFNPGSPTDKFFAPYNSCGILEIDKEIVGRIIKL